MDVERRLGPERVGLSVGLLAILLAMSSMYDWLRSITFELFGLQIRMSYGFISVGCLLGAGIYAYAWSYILDTKKSIVRRLGDGLYALALVVPAMFVMAYGLASAAGALDQESTRLVNLLAAFIGALSGYLTIHVGRKMQKLDRIKAGLTAHADLSEAKTLHSRGKYDESAARSAAVVHAHRSLSIPGLVEARNLVQNMRRRPRAEKVTAAESRQLLDAAQSMVDELLSGREPVQLLWASDLDPDSSTDEAPDKGGEAF